VDRCRRPIERLADAGSSARRLTAGRNCSQPARYRAAPATQAGEGGDHAVTGNAAQRGRRERQDDDPAGWDVEHEGEFVAGPVARWLAGHDLGDLLAAGVRRLRGSNLHAHKDLSAAAPTPG